MLRSWLYFPKACVMDLKTLDLRLWVSRVYNLVSTIISLTAYGAIAKALSRFLGWTVPFELWSLSYGEGQLCYGIPKLWFSQEQPGPWLRLYIKPSVLKTCWNLLILTSPSWCGSDLLVLLQVSPFHNSRGLKSCLAMTFESSSTLRCPNVSIVITIMTFDSLLCL